MIIYGMNYDLHENPEHYWFAVHKDREDDDCGYGSFNYGKAKEMLKEFGSDGYMSVWEESGSDAICAGELEYDDIF